MVTAKATRRTKPEVVTEAVNDLWRVLADLADIMEQDE